MKFFWHIESDKKTIIGYAASSGKEERKNMMKMKKGFDLDAMMKDRRLCFDMEQLLEVQHPGESFALVNKLTKENPMIMDDEYVESIIAQLYELGSGQLFVDYALCDVDYARSQVTGRPMVKTLSSIG